jgi:hypothetical protein
MYTIRIWAMVNNFHLAFVHKVGRKAGRAASEDNLLVFYLPNAAEWERAVARLEELGHKPVKAFNPYWDKKEDV